jgi:hypothetical protein
MFPFYIIVGLFVCFATPKWIKGSSVHMLRCKFLESARVLREKAWFIPAKACIMIAVSNKKAEESLC